MQSGLLRSNDRVNKSIMFSGIKTYIFEDILDDIKLILRRLKSAGLKRAIIVDLTQPNIGVPVVRAIVPGLETFEISKLFSNDQYYIGNRARRHYRELYDC